MDTIKIFHIMTGGLQREGISSTQLEIFKHMNLEKNRIYVAAVHNNSSEMIKAYEAIGCTVISFPDRKENTIRYFLALLRELKRVKPDIVHVHGSSAIMCIELLASKLAGIRVRIAHSRNTRADQEKVDKMLRPVFYRLYTDGLACGEEAGRWMFGTREFTVVHNGKDFEQFKYDSELRNKQRWLYELKNKRVIGHVGNFNYQKNHEYLVRVFCEYLKINSNAVLYLIGTGPLLRDIKKQVEYLGISDKVIFAGSVNNVAERLEAMDIMVFPSRFEGLPNVVLEWQAEGLPCLISNKITTECACSKLVNYASIEDEPKEWANQIENIIQRYMNREKQASEGTRALKQNGFDIEDSAKQMELIYSNLACRK